ncbi:MAG TPA: DUF1573 domain-containing protein [Flavobacteriales bacterium]|nr:DUF1573 domain-containing protein [Flavobacteriales bacterium]
MKKLFSFACAALLAFAAAAQSGPRIQVDKEVHDYGTIPQGANGECVFTVTNTGDAPLILTNCKGSCGCTVPKCDTAPIAPGQKSSITVRYDTKRTGPINKSVTISSNAANEPDKVVRIKGMVEGGAAEGGSN